MDMCAIFWLVWLHVASVGFVVDALPRDFGRVQRNAAQIVQTKPSRVRHKRYIEDDEFSFMKSAHQANEIVHSLEMIENEHPELPLERRSDIAHVFENRKSENIPDRAEIDSSGYVRNLIDSAHSPVSPHKLYRMDPQSFTPLYQKKFKHRPKYHASNAKPFPRPSTSETTAIAHGKKDTSNKNSKYIVTLPTPESKSVTPVTPVAISNPRNREDIIIDFRNSAEVSNLEDSSGTRDQQQQDIISGTDSGYGEDNFEGSTKTSELLQNTVNKNKKVLALFTAHKSNNIIPSSLTETDSSKGIVDDLFISGDSDRESSGDVDVHRNDANEHVAISGKYATGFAASGFREDIKEEEDSSGSGHDDEISSNGRFFKIQSSTKHLNMVSSLKNIFDKPVSASGKNEEEMESAFEFPISAESDDFVSEATHETSVSGDSDGNRDLVLSSSDSESGQGSTSYHHEGDVPQTPKQEQTLTAKGDDYAYSGEKAADRLFSGDTNSKTKLSGKSDSGGKTFGESDEGSVASEENESGSSDDMFSGNDDESGTSGSNVDRRSKVTDKETNLGTSSGENFGENVSGDGNSPEVNGDIDESAQKVSAKSDFVSGESGSGETQASSFGEDVSVLNSGDTAMKVSGIQDAQKQHLSVHPGNLSNHDQINNSPALKEISKQLGFPAHTANLPKKSNDKESLPSAGSYSEEPDIIRAEENQSIQSSTLFEHSSGEHSREDELEGSATRDSESSRIASGSGGSSELSSADDHSFMARPHIFSPLEEEYSGSSGFEMQDAQKQKLSIHPGNVSHHDQITNSSSLKEISKQLGFPAQTSNLPKKSDDKESFPSAGSYDEEPDLIKNEDNQSIKSSPLFEHSSSEHSGEYELEHSSGEHSGKDELEGNAIMNSESTGMASGSGGNHELSSADDHSFKVRPQVFNALEEEYSGSSGREMHTEQENSKNVESLPKHVGEESTGKSTQSYLSAEQQQSTKEENTKITAALGKLEQQLVTRLKEIESKNTHAGSRTAFGYKHLDHTKVGHHIETFQSQHSGEVPQEKPRKHYSTKSNKVSVQHRKTGYKGKSFNEDVKVKENTKAEEQIQVAKPSVQTVERIQLVGEKEKLLNQSVPSKPKFPVTSEAEHHEEPQGSAGQENENLESVLPTQKPLQQTHLANNSSDTTSKMTYLKENMDQMKNKVKTEQNLTAKGEEVSERRIAEKLLTQLDKLKFGHDPGTVWHSSRFQYVKQCGLYVEQYNVTKVDSSWNDNPWQPYPYLYDVPDNYHKCKTASWMNNTDLRGDVFLSFQVRLNKGRTEQDYARVCSRICCAKTRCRSWTLRLQKASTRNCPKSTFCCWLKSAVPTPITNQDYCTSGIAGRKDTRHPPAGMRSAVPLGGMGTGSFELRADGTFHEWTIENQSPGGSAKLNKGALDLAVFGVRVASEGSSTSSLLRVHPPHGYPGVAALSYSGAFPVAKLSPAGLLTREVDIDLYAYSAFHPRDSRKSATPAVAFTLGLHNKRGKVPKEVSFMFNLPLGVQHDTIRAGNNFGEVVFTRLIKPSDCAYACDKMPKCVSWTTNGPTSCMLKNQMPLHSWAPGIVTGLKGEWSVENSMLTLERPGFFPQSGSTTLLAVDEKDTNTSFAVIDDFQQMWKQFAETGSVGANASVSRVGLYGAASLRTVLQPGESKSLTIIMSWYYPHRDIARLHVGNFYSNLFSSSKDVALHMRRDLLPSIKDIRAWQGPFLLPSSGTNDSPKPEAEEVNRLPVWLQDMMINSVSFWRSGFWTEDKRWRQWEALDCNKIDSVQNDMQRIMPYVLFFPEFVRDLLVSWSKTQLSDGMIEEALTTGCLGKTEKLDYAGGRSMGDTTSLFVVELYHYFLWTNDTELLDQLWPPAKRAASWSISEATKGTELPFRKVNAYDLLSLDKYDHSIYNSVVYLLTLRAAEKLAALKNDTSFGRLMKETYVKASKRMDLELWDKPKGFYHAWWDMEYGSPPWIMSDSLYGQVWAYTLGLGELLDVKKLRSHLEKEVENNDTPFGLKALSTERKEMSFEDTSVILGRGAASCRSLENITKHNSVWMGADASWATNMIHLGVDPGRALNRARKALDHWRAKLNDQWNIHGLTSSSGYGLDGLPWATSHYSSHLMMWHIPLALSGQQYSAPDASLTFMPRYNTPYELPFFTPTASGTIKATHSTGNNKKEDNEEMYTLSVVSGKLHLKRLAVSGTTYGKGDITLHQGDMVSWSKPQYTIRDILSQLKH